ncbi:MAG: hypothetical protein H7318_14810 [Oligoflexus sp.]|nr:hypothetical protein [Oligoflexus sp.]
MKASDSQPCLKSLKADFKAFRTQSRPHTRIPDHLRRAALEAIASGLKPSLVASNLKVSPSQLIRWQQRNFPKAIPKDAPRILDVIPLIPGPVIPTGLRVTYEAGRLVLELSF